jgi:putative endonuclease
MHYVYILRSKKDQELYVGCTNNLKDRIKRHNAGKVHATKDRLPLHLIHYEMYMNKQDAFAREQWLKTGWGRRHLQKSLQNYLKSLGG